MGAGRRNCYGIYPPATEEYPNGQMKPPKAICYVSDWLTGFAVLTSYKAGTYIPGMEKNISIADKKEAGEFVQALLADYNQMIGIETKHEKKSQKTFETIFKEYYLDKFKNEYGHPGKKRSMEYSMTAAFKNCAALHDRPFDELKRNDLQSVVNNCGCKHASLELIVTLYHQMYRYALANDLCKKDYSQFISIEKADDDETGVPFSDQEIDILWKNQSDSIIAMLLIMCYSGYRISAYADMEVNLKEGYLRGGVKTASGKNRIVPIHSGICDLISQRMKTDGKLLNISPAFFRSRMYETLERLGIEKHTPHDCRHTFSRLCEKYGVNENDRKRLLGHAFNDITNARYGHRSIEDLRYEIEKIKI